MCDRCRSIMSKYMPAILLAAASTWAAEQVKRTPDIPTDALAETAASLDLLAELALLAKSRRDAGDMIDTRLGSEETKALRRTATLAWYAGELMQSLAGMICTVLTARAIEGGDGGAAEYMLTGVGRTVVDSPMAEEAEEMYNLYQMSSLVNSIARGVAQAHKGKPAQGEPEFKH